MPNPKFVNKINFLQEPGTSETVMPSDDLLMYLEKYIVAPAEEMCEYGIYSKAREIPIFFVSEKTINQKRLAIARGVFFDLRKLLEFVDGDRFWKLWENEFNTTERLLVKDDFDEALEGTLVKWTDPIGLYLPKGEFQDQGQKFGSHTKKSATCIRNGRIQNTLRL